VDDAPLIEISFLRVLWLSSRGQNELQHGSMLAISVQFLYINKHLD
jgi:hypothetical protein